MKNDFKRTFLPVLSVASVPVAIPFNSVTVPAEVTAPEGLKSMYFSSFRPLPV